MKNKGGTYLNFRLRQRLRRIPRARVGYISRPTAVLDGRSRLGRLRNMPDEVSRSESYQELRTNLTSYAWAREESEIARHKSRGAPPSRTFARR